MTLFQNVWQLRQCLLLYRSIVSSKCFESKAFMSDVARRVTEPHYNIEEEKIILQMLNECTVEDMVRFDVSKGRIRKLHQYRSKYGEFRELKQMLEVDGLGVQVLKKLCDSILGSSNPGAQVEEKIKGSNLKIKKQTNRTQVLTPPLDSVIKKEMQSAVGIHIGLDTVSWANISRGSKLLDWELHHLNLGAKKLHPTTLLETVLDVKRHLPESDVYIMEDGPSGIPPMMQQHSSIALNLQNYQLSAMLIAVLNAKSMQDVSEDNMVNPLCHRVHFLRSRLPARLFRTLVGSERVSAQTVVEDILSSPPGEPTSPKKSPLHYTPILVESQVRDKYLAMSNIEKENLCIVLLLTMSFMDIVVHGTSPGLRGITTSGKQV